MGIELDVEVDTSAAMAMLQNGLDNLTDGVSAALDQGGSEMQDTAQSIVHVRTGRLRSSITYSVDGLTLTFTATAYYAPYVEFGHMTRTAKHPIHPRHRVPAEPFLRPAFYQVLPQLEDAIAAAVANAFGQ